MDATTNDVTFRIACCQRQKAKARTRIELEAWRAEEEGLRMPSSTKITSANTGENPPPYLNGT